MSERIMSGPTITGTAPNSPQDEVQRSIVARLRDPRFDGPLNAAAAVEIVRLSAALFNAAQAMRAVLVDPKDEYATRGVLEEAHDEARAALEPPGPSP